MVDDGRSLRGGFRYRTDPFTQATIEQALDRFAVLVERMVAEPDLRTLDVLLPE